MSAEDLRAMLRNYDLGCGQLEKVGLVVKEIEGYSDRPYFFIGAEYADERGKSGDPWAFTGETVGSFIEKANLYLKGFKDGKR